MPDAAPQPAGQHPWVLWPRVFWSLPWCMFTSHFFGKLALAQFLLCYQLSYRSSVEPGAPCQHSCLICRLLALGGWRLQPTSRKHAVVCGCAVVVYLLKVHAFQCCHALPAVAGWVLFRVPGSVCALQVPMNSDLVATYAARADHVTSLLSQLLGGRGLAKAMQSFRGKDSTSWLTLPAETCSLQTDMI